MYIRENIVQLFKSFCVPVISYALEAVSPNKSSIYMLDNLINRAVFRIFKCSSMSEIWFIRSMFDLEAIGVMLERRQSNFVSKFRCSVLYISLFASKNADKQTERDSKN